jgi:hypothetical protein
MKTTFLFFAFLIFVNCSTDLLTPTISSEDSVLTELSKDPNAEPLFATMAIQLQAHDSKSAGFNRVLSLLKQLVYDSKEQLHSMTKVWRGVQTRCQVSKIKLRGRQEYFDTYYGQAQRSVSQATTALGQLKDNLGAFQKSLNAYTNLLKWEINDHKRSRDSLAKRNDWAKSALNHLKEARNAVSNWSPKGRALVQTHIEEASKLYSSINNVDLPNITEFLERTTDGRVRRRLLEWLNVVNVHLSAGHAKTSQAIKKLDDLHKATQNALAKMVLQLNSGINHIQKGIHFNNELVNAGKKASSLFGDLAKENSKLVSANKAYCHAERVSFKKNEAQAISAIKLFRHLKDYFNNNYSKIHSYIKAKYHW